MLTMKYLTLKTRLLALLLLAATCAAAQPTPAQLASRPELTASIYHSYEYLPGPAAPVPDGYEPFYISHYGRHGSRYHSKEEAYAEPLAALRKADKAGALTPKGREVLAKVETLAADACKRYGDLSPRGVQEHRGIAERMFAAYPGVFSTDGGRVCRIESRSTQVPRCILSMAAFNERLKELNPAIRATRDASARDLCLLFCPSYPHPGRDVLSGLALPGKVLPATALLLRHIPLQRKRPSLHEGRAFFAGIEKGAAAYRHGPGYPYCSGQATSGKD